ncbi:MAG: JAB domain-containing protein [Anaerolineales bacterium]|jgi:DNA repair protein RadC|nr:JAB domain-containing protein [Anaerolineales bacterium]HJO34176.1 JAB domain-containing protein [Anaerolineales bacterium]|tara:strand:- start:145 stop:453 length:309 start_codon:yes stop_codon:yes gene_type:complete
MLLLDATNRDIHTSDVCRGSLNASMIRESEIIHDTVRHNAARLIVAHNHPGGDPEPSQEDVVVTRNSVEAGELLDINVIDHSVIGRRQHVSLHERGLDSDVA